MPGTRTTASEQLERLLYLLPAAARQGGCRLDELAKTLGTTVSRVVRDLEEVTARSYYHPAGGADNLQIRIDGDRVRIWTTGEFHRPLKLSPLEALALALGFRILAAERDPDRRPMLLSTASRIESQLSGASAERLLAGFAVDGGDRGGTDLLAILRRAATDRLQCRIEYLKAHDTRAEDRVVHPYALVRADAGWYAIAYCREREDIRTFRLDRMLSATLLPCSFEVPDDFDPGDWLAPDGRVYRASEEVEALVRYSPRIARWIREKGPVEDLADGSVIVRHEVADPDWVIRQVLQYGPDAEILEPYELRRQMAELLGTVIRQAENVRGGAYDDVVGR